MGFLIRVLKPFLYLFTFLILLVMLTNIWIVQSTRSKVYCDYDSIADNSVALVLGTSSLLSSGQPNPYFNNRMKTAADLYKLGKVKHFIVSGDNRTKYYNEPMVMQRALLNRGVPLSAITLDYAGLRTLDSIVRSKEIFGQQEITIITQNFHCYRALFISDFYGIEAVAYVANDPVQANSKLVHWREYFARTKAVLDLYVLQTAPRHLGQKEPIKL